MSPPTLLKEDLKRSGLTQQHSKKLGLKVIQASKLSQETNDAFKDVPAYKIPYYEVTGKRKDFYRIRFLQPPKQTGFKKAKKPLRYWQPPNTHPALYFCPLVSWKSITEDVSNDVYITEGEKKAAKACAEGLFCIGLGGVWSWRSKKLEQPILDDFKQFQWKDRNVYLCFDSDSHTNPKVIQALNCFALAMTEMGAKVYTIELHSKNDEEKVGLDDYLVKRGVKNFMALPRTAFSKSEELWKLNEEVAYIKELGAVYMIESGVVNKSKQQLAEVIYANRNYTLFDAHQEKWVTYNAMKEWLKWPFRREHQRLTFAPGAPEVTDKGELNVWKGWNVEPKRGEVKPFIDLVNFLFAEDKQYIPWFMQWLAYPIQNPGEKMYSSVLIWSRYQGTGKSFLGYIMGDIYGEGFNVVTEDQLHDDYNEWLISKQFILGEEITGVDKRRDRDRLKNLTTQESVLVRAKYQPTYRLPDLVNYLFTSNHPDSMFVEETDRRMFILEVCGPPAKQEFYKRIERWRNSGGPAHLLYHLLNSVDCSKFNPKAAPPMTETKKDMVSLSKSDLDLMVDDIRIDPDSVLSMGGIKAERDLFTLEEIISFVQRNEQHGVNISRIALSKALRRAGCVQRAVWAQGKTRKLWALRNIAHWARADSKAWADGYATATANMPTTAAAVTPLRGRGAKFRGTGGR